MNGYLKMYFKEWTKYNNYKNLFQTIKKKAKKICYFNKLLKCTGDIENNQGDIKNFWYNQKIKNRIDKSSM